MKKETSGGSKNPKPKILGATPLQISEDDAAKLVGGIVEKGFSDIQQNRPLRPSAGPRPTVLPFPAARHRSHGPYLLPKVGSSNVINDNDYVDDDNEEEEDYAGMETAASFADPVQRKEKKGIDFSWWREIVKKDGNSTLYEKKKEMHSTNAKEKNSDHLSRRIGDIKTAQLSWTSRVDHAKEQLTTVDDKASTVKEVKEGTEGISETATAKDIYSFRDGQNEKIQNSSHKEKQVDLKMQHMQESPMSSGFASKSMVGGEGSSLESQIDAENCARLAEMSADEIAEAQAEIMAKLNPELINALKKRGQAKFKRQKFSSLDVITGGKSGSMQQENNMSKLSEGSDTPVKIVPGDTPKDKDDKVFPNIIPQNRSMWDVWSKRVESVRDLRFSLDGNIVSSDSVHVSDTGKASSESGYNADNVSERDFLRTEGDPGAAGYTIKEAVALTRSVVPGQRTLALHLIAAVLDRAIRNIWENPIASTCVANVGGSVDWEAVWAFALGPEPELALSLRIALDDNHNSVVLSCAKAIQCALSCDMNDIIFDISEKTPSYAGDVCTAPVFRSKPDVNVGFLRGGFWKYNTKPSNILCFGEEPVRGTAEDECTIQDDVVISGQDVAAGLVRMGILPRICYLLETDPAAPLEECLLSILIAIARHSPTCAAAVVDCERLVQTIASRFASKEQMEINSCKIKSVMLLKVLAGVEQKNCLTFIKNGTFRQVTWHLYRYPFSIDQWVKAGKEACKLSSALLVEQLRLLKVFMRHGYCISDFSGLFPSLCIWLSVPTIEKLVNKDVMNEYFAITKEVYLLVDVLAARLPNFYPYMHEKTSDAARDKETWSWSQFGPVIDLAIEWIELKSIPCIWRLFDSKSKGCEKRNLQDSEVNSFLWVISSVLNVLSSLLKAVIPEDNLSLQSGRLPWLPEFIPKIGLAIIKNGYFSSAGVSDTICRNHVSEIGPVLDYLCHLMLKKREVAISSTCCLQGLVQVVSSIDKLIQHANLDIHSTPLRYQTFLTEDNVLANGILKSCEVEVRYLLTTLTKLITNEWRQMQPVEMFGRGGPAPGVGVGWGAPGGGYWSLNNLSAQQDARLLVYLFETSEIIPFNRDQSETGEIGSAMETLNCALAACLIVGPGNSLFVDKLLKVIFEVPLLKNLDFGIREFLSLRKGHTPFVWNYEEEGYMSFANVLATHFRKRWLSVKKKRKSTSEADVSHKSMKKAGRSLETIHEDMHETDVGDEKLSSLSVEWAHQRLPLPAHWFLSAISTVHLEKNPCTPGASYKETNDFHEVAKGGLFFLLGIEAMPTFISSEFDSPVKYVPIVWKLHAMSAILLSGMGVLQDEKSRDVYGTLQNVYGEMLHEIKSSNLHDSLKFETDIHENYSTFIEALIEQFAAESYGNILFARQIAIYLHRSVEASVRLATWDALSNTRILELLPRLDKCITKAEGYLEPIEDDEKILEAYVKSWVSGALDKAATRSSMAFSLVLHHLSSFIFGDVSGDRLSLRNKLVKSLLRDYSRKQAHEGTMVKLICYEKPNMNLHPIPETASSLNINEMEKRLQLLKEVCDGNATLVEKLESCIRREL